MLLPVQVSSYSLQSSFRTYNQDLFWPDADRDGNITYPVAHELLKSRGYLFIVASGAGMSPYGLEACRLGIQTFMREYYRESTPLDVKTGLHASFQAANESVYEYTSSRVPDRIPGNSMVAAVLKGDELTIGNMGLSGAYLVRKTNVEKVVPLKKPSPSDTERFQPALTLLLGSRDSFAIRNDVTQPIESRLYLELAYDLKITSEDILILSSDGFAGLDETKREEVLDLIKPGLDTTIAQRLAQHVGALSSTMNFTFTVIWLSR